MARPSRRRARAARAEASSGDLPNLPNLPSLPPLPDLGALQDLGPLPVIDDLPDLPPLDGARAAAGAGGAAASRGEPFTTNARDGLRLRAGPGTNFNPVKTLPFGTPLVVIGREDAWAKVDLEGDGAADGFVLFSLLAPATDAAPAAAPAVGDIIDSVTAEQVATILGTHTAAVLANIRTNLPFVMAGLRATGLTDKPMVLMTIATIRVETASFKPIDEFKSRFNTARTPFDLYDAGTPIGRRLGNTVPGDGPRFKGRGYVQLTGRSNYTKIGAQIGQPLATNPALANDPGVAGLILATFLKNKEAAIRAALGRRDLATARKLVNGGSHGLAEFIAAFRRGEAAL